MYWNPEQYDDHAELVGYVWHNYRHLFSEDVLRAEHVLLTEAKAKNVSSESLRARLLSSGSWGRGPEIDELLAEGMGPFRSRAADELLAQRRAEVVINRCSRCARIVATPLARQCLWCGHDWHHAGG